MSESLALPDADRNLLDLPRQCVTEQSLQLPAGLSIEAWSGLGQQLDLIGDGLHWWLGDWAAYGEQAFGEAAYQFYEDVASRLGPERLRIYIRISQRYRVEERVAGATWSHHRVLMGLPVEEARLWLFRAVENKWSVAQMLEHLREAQGTRVHKTDRHGAINYSAAKVGNLWSEEDHHRLCELLGGAT